MPRFFDDYSNTYLTHDSAAGRKQQRRGWKFRENFKLHYHANLKEWQAGPMGLASAQQEYIRRHRNPASGQIGGPVPVPPLPEGWTEELDDATGVSFYVHEESGERSWVRPGFVPPNQGGPPPSTNFRPPPPQFQQPPPNNQFNRPPPAFLPPPGQGPPPVIGIPP